MTLEFETQQSLALALTDSLSRDDGDTPHTLYMAIAEWEANNLIDLQAKPSICANEFCNNRAHILCNDCKARHYCLECDGIDNRHNNGCLYVE